MQLETKRIQLRHFEMKDLDDLYAYASQPGVGEAAGWKHHTSRSESEHVLQEYMKNDGMFAVVEKSSNRVIGHVGIYEDSEEHKPEVKELGFVLNQQSQRQGYMSEILPCVLSYLFTHGIHNVYACCFQENEASHRLIQKCGFVLEQEGTFFSQSLQKEFASFENVLTLEQWKATHGATLAAKNQIMSTYHMLYRLIEVCPKAVWNQRFSEVPFWYQVYHCVYFMDFWFRLSYEEEFIPLSKVGKGIPPEFETEIADDWQITQEDMLTYCNQLWDKIECVFYNLADDMLGKENPKVWYNTYMDIINCQNRHVMYNIGYLNGILRTFGYEESDWWAYNEKND